MFYVCQVFELLIYHFEVEDMQNFFFRLLFDETTESLEGLPGMQVTYISTNDLIFAKIINKKGQH